MKKILVNLKDWFDLKENVEFSKKIEGLDITLFPSMPYLTIYKDRGVKLGSQDVSSYESGAHTGSVSIEHLIELGVSCVLLNHKEMRIENEDVLYDKISKTIKNDIAVVLCILDSSKDELDNLTRIFNRIEDTSKISIAYEPIENLGLDKIKKDLQIIRKTVENFEIDSLIYGGNVSKDNVALYNEELNVDGYLISRHALNIDELKEILKLTR